LATAATRVVVLFTFLGIPFTTGLGLELALSVLLPLVIHNTAIRKFLTALLGGDLLTFHEGGLIGLRSSMGGCLLDGVLLGCSDAL
jgi:hypothetical protein